LLTQRPPPASTLFPYTTLFRSGLELGVDEGAQFGLVLVLVFVRVEVAAELVDEVGRELEFPVRDLHLVRCRGLTQFVGPEHRLQDRKSTRLNSSHVSISYAVFC